MSYIGYQLYKMILRNNIKLKVNYIDIELIKYSLHL